MLGKQVSGGKEQKISASVPVDDPDHSKPKSFTPFETKDGLHSQSDVVSELNRQAQQKLMDIRLERRAIIHVETVLAMLSAIDKQLIHMRKILIDQSLLSRISRSYVMDYSGALVALDKLRKDMMASFLEDGSAAELKAMDTKQAVQHLITLMNDGLSILQSSYADQKELNRALLALENMLNQSSLMEMSLHEYHRQLKSEIHTNMDQLSLVQETLQRIESVAFSDQSLAAINAKIVGQREEIKGNSE